MIIPARNTCGLLGRCLDSLIGQELRGGFETIVVDNASTDGTAELLRARGDAVRAIENERNRGFAEANNQAAEAARGRILFFLNSDTELLAPDTLERLAAAVEAPGVGIAGPMLVNPDGSLQPSCAADPSVGRALMLAAGLHRLLPDRLRARWSPDTWSHSRSGDTGWVKGAALAVGADTFREVGGFWPTMYGEEQDLAYRVRQRGLRVRFESSARIMHVGNQTAAQHWSDAGRAERVATAELVFLDTHYARPRAAAIRLITGSGYAVRTLAHGLRRDGARARLYRAMARVYATGPSD